MKNKLRKKIKRGFFVVAIGLFYLAVFTKISRAEEIKFSFDGRKWGVGHENIKATRSVVEYVLEGETVENWTELVTLNTIYTPSGQEIEMTPTQILKASIIDRLKKQCPSLKWDVIQEGEKTVLYEWIIVDCPTVIGGKKFDYDEHEIGKILIGKHLYFLTYATKKIPVSQDRREKWIEILSSSALVEDDK